VGVQVSLQASHNILFSGRDVLFSLTIDLIGNIHTDGKPPMPADLVTPTIKQDFYTTGRGGSGNMMFNDKDRPEIARGSQDVEEPPKRSLESVQFTGRGMFSFVFPPHSNLMLTHNVFPQVVSPTLSSLASRSKRPKTPPLPSVLGNSETEYRRKKGPRKFLAARLPRHEKQNRGLDRKHCPLFSFFGCLFNIFFAWVLGYPFSGTLAYYGRFSGLTSASEYDCRFIIAWTYSLFRTTIINEKQQFTAKPNKRIIIKRKKEQLEERYLTRAGPPLSYAINARSVISLSHTTYAGPSNHQSTFHLGYYYVAQRK
jgi:hypothetical protein